VERRRIPTHLPPAFRPPQCRLTIPAILPGFILSIFVTLAHRGCQGVWPRIAVTSWDTPSSRGLAAISLHILYAGRLVRLIPLGRRAVKGGAYSRLRSFMSSLRISM
jgi:hypothetical protein